MYGQEIIIKLLCCLALCFVSGAQKIQELNRILNYFLYNHYCERAHKMLLLGFSMDC